MNPEEIEVLSLLPAGDDGPPPAPTRINVTAADNEAMHRAWLAGMVQRDERALAAFYEATVARVYGLALRITRFPEAAEDVTAEVYWQVWREAARYDAARGRVLPWLATICRSRALDHLRARDRAQSLSELTPLIEATQTDDNNPQDILLAVERDGALHGALAKLSVAQCEILGLAFFRGLTHQEIAASTKMPIGTVKSHIRRALRKLRRELGQDTVAVP